MKKLKVERKERRKRKTERGRNEKREERGEGEGKGAPECLSAEIMSVILFSAISRKNISALYSKKNVK